MNYTQKVASVNINAIQVKAKLNLLKEFIQQNDIDIVMLQEVDIQNFTFIQSHYAIINVPNTLGVAFLIKNNLNYEGIVCDMEGRIISVVINSTNYINIYGHSGSQRRKEREELFSEKILPHINKSNVTNTVIGGDFNCWLNPTDSKGAANTFSPGLKSLISTMQLKDLEIEKKGSATKFSFTRGNSASRLDRFYVSRGIVEKTCDFDTKELSFSDHHAKLFKIKVNPNELGQISGKGIWKINSSFLNNDEIENIFCFYYENLKKIKLFKDNFILWWCTYMKRKTKHFYKSKSIQFNQEINSRKSFYYKALIELSESNESRDIIQSELRFIKTKILQIESEKMMFYESKQPNDNLVAGEKIGLYQIAAIQKRQK